MTVVIGFSMLVAAFILWKAGVWNAIAGVFVRNTISAMQEEAERQNNQPRTVILKTGERIECRKVTDGGQHWGLIRTDGRVMSVKKDEVLAIEVPEAK